METPAILLERDSYNNLKEYGTELIEFIITVSEGNYYLHFPHEINIGWQTDAYKKHLEDNLFFRGYAKNKEDVNKIFKALRIGGQSLEIIHDIDKKIKHPIKDVDKTLSGVRQMINLGIKNER